jgi:EAL domain-containing protein (putative c-di-GMP-specific phosphodiesterase class I)
MRPVVFIACAREDDDEAEVLHRQLSSHDCDTRLDKRSLTEELDQRDLRQADFFLACLSSHSASNAGFYQTKLKEAYDALKDYPKEDARIIAVRLEEDCGVPDQLREHRLINLFRQDGKEVLINAINDEWRIHLKTRANSRGVVSVTGHSSGRQLNLLGAEPDRDALTAERLQQALDDKEMMLYYQPKVHVNDRCVFSVESLIRWQHPTRGLVSPTMFIPVAESSGVIEPLTEWVLNEALRQCSIWNRAGVKLTVGVNVSGRNLESGNLVKKVKKALNRHRAIPEWLQLEITETAIMSNFIDSMKQLEALRKMKVQIALDDFGAGTAGYGALLERKSIWSELKLDASLVTKSMESEAFRELVVGVIQSGRTMGLEVIAEGVASQATYDHAAGINCNGVQGYHVSKALPPDAFIKWLINSKWKVAEN